MTEPECSPFPSWYKQEKPVDINVEPKAMEEFIRKYIDEHMDQFIKDYMELRWKETKP